MSAPSPIPGFHHTSMVVGDIRQSIRFWTELLGLVRHESPPADTDDGEERVLVADRAGSLGSIIELVHAPDAPSGRWGVGGIHHVALGTTDRHSLLRWKRWLEDGGHPVSGPYNRGYFHSIYFRDPDGHVIEIATAGPGYAVDEPAHQLGESFIDASAHEGRLRGQRDEEAIEEETHSGPVDGIDADMRLTGIHHITGITDDMEEADRLHRRILGLPLVKRTVNQDDGKTRHWFWARYDGTEVAPRSAMTLFGWPGSTYRGREGRGATRHIAWRVPDETALDDWHVHLETEGLSVTGPVDRGFTRSLSFQAPDGLRIHLSTDGPGLLPASSPSSDPDPA